MPRSVPEWIGKTPDTAIPPRVKLRLWERSKGHCEGCGRRLLVGEPWAADHKIPLIEGGENRESNLQVLGVKCCHKGKTREEVKRKSESQKKQKHLLGIKSRKGKPLPGTYASGIRKKMDGTVLIERDGKWIPYTDAKGRLRADWRRG